MEYLSSWAVWDQFPRDVDKTNMMLKEQIEGKARNGKQLIKILMVEIWLEVFIDNVTGIP